MHYQHVVSETLDKHQIPAPGEMLGPLLELLRMAHDAAASNAAEARPSYHDGLEGVTNSRAASMAEGLRNLARTKASILGRHAETAGEAGQSKERAALHSRAVRLQALADILDRCLAIWDAKDHGN